MEEVRRRSMPRFSAEFWLVGFLLLAAIPSIVIRFLGANSFLIGDEHNILWLSSKFGRVPDHILNWDASAPGNQLFLELPLFYLQRPLFYLLILPGAAIGPVAMRIWFILLSLSVPILLYLLMKHERVPVAARIIALLVVLYHPLFLRWSVWVFPDMLLIAFILGGILMLRTGRTGWGWLLLSLGGFVKEPGIFLIPVAIVVHFLDLRSKGHRLEWRQFVAPFYAFMVPLSFLLLTILFNATVPGWAEGDELLPHLDGMFLSIFTVPFLLAGLLHSRARYWALWSFGTAAFFVANTLIRQVAIQSWYYIIPNVFVILTIVALIPAASKATRHAQVTAPAATHPTSELNTAGNMSLSRIGVHAFASLAVLVLIGSTAIPAAMPVDHDARSSLHPFTPHHVPNLPSMLDTYQTSKGTIVAMELLQELEPEVIHMVDGFWGHALFPFGTSANRVIMWDPLDPMLPDDLLGASRAAAIADGALIVVPGESAWASKVLTYNRDCNAAALNYYTIIDARTCTEEAT